MMRIKEINLLLLIFHLLQKHTDKKHIPAHRDVKKPAAASADL